MMNIKSYAKVNLFLLVKPLNKNDKLHDIKSCFALHKDLYDEITIEKIDDQNDEIIYYSENKNLTISNCLISRTLNVLRENNYIKDHYKIEVKKNIPPSSGLGGGSSNAASVVKFILKTNKKFKPDKKLIELLHKISSDMIFFLYDYDFANHVGYILQDSIELVLAGNNEPQTYVNVSFDANGGTFKDGSSYISYNMPQGIPSIEEPTKDHGLFIGWDQQLSSITKDTVYVAQYKEVASIEMLALPKQAYEVNERIDLTDGMLKVNFSDGSNEEVQLTTAMVSGYDLSSASDQEVLVTYGGTTVTYPISVSQELDDLRKEITAQIDVILTLDPNALTDEDKTRILDLKQQINDGIQPYLKFAMI